MLLPDISVAELALIVALAAVSAVAGGVAGYGTGALMPLILVPISLLPWLLGLASPFYAAVAAGTGNRLAFDEDRALLHGQEPADQV